MNFSNLLIAWANDDSQETWSSAIFPFLLDFQDYRLESDCSSIAYYQFLITYLSLDRTHFSLYIRTLSGLRQNEHP